MSGKDAVTKTKSWRETLSVYFQYNILLIFLLGIASGFPIVLTANGTVFQARLENSGLDLPSIGIFALVGLPYSLKIFIAPFMDGIHFPWAKTHLANRKSWCILAQLLLVTGLFGMSRCNPIENTFLLGCFALLTATASAMQDIMIDAMRIEMVTKDSQGAASATAVTGYRVGARLVAAGGCLLLAEYLSWDTVYFITCGVAALGIPVVLMIRHLDGVEEVSKDKSEDTKFELLKLKHIQNHKAVAVISKVYHLFIHPLRDFFTHPAAILILFFIALFKLGDAMAGSMITTFYLKMGFEKGLIGLMKNYELIPLLAGTFFGGFLVKKMTINSALWICGTLQILSNFVFIALVYTGPNSSVLATCITVESFTGGMGSTAFVAFMSQLCSVRFTATQYALLTSISSLGRTLFAGSAGFIIDNIGWTPFYIFTAVLGLPGMGLLYLIQQREKKSEKVAAKNIDFQEQ